MNFLQFVKNMCKNRPQSVLPELPPAQTQAESPAQFDPQELVDNPSIETANRYGQALDSEWQRYLKWRDSQVCVNCKTPFGSESKNLPNGGTGWVTEIQCWDCYHKYGYAGSSRDAYLAETRNVLL